MLQHQGSWTTEVLPWDWSSTRTHGIIPYLVQICLENYW